MPEDWDDTIHIQTNTDIPSNSVEQHSLATPALRPSSDTVDLATRSGVLGRRIDPRICQYIRTCALLAYQQNAFHLQSIIDAFIHAGEQVLQLGKDYGPSLWEFLNQPLIVALTIGTGGAVLSGAVSAWTSASIAESECSKADRKATDAEIIRNMVNELGSAQTHRSISANIQIGDVTATITLEAVPNGQEFDQGCKTPSRKLIADGTNIIEETKAPEKLIAIEGLTPEEYQQSKSTLANIDQAADQTEPSAVSHGSTSDSLILPRHSLHVTSMTYIRYGAQIASGLAHIMLVLFSIKAQAFYSTGTAQIFLGSLVLRVSATNGNRLTDEIVLTGIKNSSRFADHGVLLTSFTMTVFGQLFLISMDVLPEAQATPEGLRISVTALDSSESAKFDPGSRDIRLGEGK